MHLALSSSLPLLEFFLEYPFLTADYEIYLRNKEHRNGYWGSQPTHLPDCMLFISSYCNTILQSCPLQA